MDFEVKMYLWILFLILKSGFVLSSTCYKYSYSYGSYTSYCSGYCYGSYGSQSCGYYYYYYYLYYDNSSSYIGSLSIGAFAGLIIGSIIFFIFFVSVTVAICKSCTRSAGQHGRIVNPTGGVSVVQTGQQQGGPGGYPYGPPQMYSNVGYHHGYPPPQPMNAYGPPHPQPMNGPPPPQPMTGPPPPPAYAESRPEVNQPPPVSTAFGGEPSTK
ncbi:Hypothetical predicted protein [Mytilus galloprovincialis]|uniref:Cysteine and tyrosine-rich protein 1 n=1 Tax=Mytilus galloprovincialis TaxID=29158 RepID=A0A8B6FEG7_MYTGA|nr:Hypothetical predicted protein [Mytilus galloprovincialis]